ncbi:hypothetical protein AMK59_2049 [Oryctes borbonicus]|uniref:Uncharacterized protein n=1 Tax=Oryctes borbonicus TaxID=1629725 RepID=A0A0T6BGF5_9SCAR|nr:hypothetical protein AMK59_2049 [Oryctes borbonicus]
MSLKFISVFLVWWLTKAEYVLAIDTYTIGAVFHEDSNEIETAFKCAVKRFNTFNNAIFFKTVIRHVPKENPFAVYEAVCKMLDENKGFAALFGPPSTSVADVVDSIASKIELPNMQMQSPSSLWPEDSSNLYTINVHPNLRNLQKGIAKTVESLQWKTYAILYQDRDSIIRLQEVMKLSSIGKESVLLKKLEPPDYRLVLKEVKRLGYAHIIIDYDSTYLMEILQQAKELGMLEYLYNYFLTSLDAHTLDFNQLDCIANITTITITDTNSKLTYGFAKECSLGRIIPTNSTDIPTTLVKHEPSLMWDAANFFMNAFHELHLTNHQVVRKLTCDGEERGIHSFGLANYMKIRPIPNTITGKINFENDHRSTLTLQVVEIMQGRLRKTAYWSAADPESVTVVRTEKEQQELIDLYIKNTTFVVSSRIGQPYLMYKKPEDPDEVLEGNDAFEGFSMDIIDHIAKMLNFSYKFVLTKNNKYGSFDKEKKTWDGLIKDILDRKAHLAICDLTITQERRSAVDFSLPFMTLGISILYTKPKPQERDIFAFMNPLDIVVWMYILAAYVSITLVMFFLTRLAPGDWENPNPNDPNPEELENIWDLKNASWLILGSTMSQGCDILPKGISSRMGISMWWFLILIISSSYTANLSAFLTTSRMGPTIDNAESLAKQNKIKYGVLNGGSTMAFFKNSNFSTYQRMWAQMSQAKPSVFVNDNAEGVKRVKTTKNQLYAFLMESSSIEYETERDCELKQVGGRLDNKGYGIAMPVNAPFRGSINSCILKMQEDGTLRGFKEKWWKQMHGGGACKNEPEASSSDMKLALDNIGGVFVVVFFGVAIACILALAEFFWNVHTISVEERKSHKEVTMNEFKFFLSVWKTKKRNYKASKSHGSLSNMTDSITIKSKSNGSLQPKED